MSKARIALNLLKHRRDGLFKLERRQLRRFHSNRIGQIRTVVKTPLGETRTLIDDNSRNLGGFPWPDKAAI
jgi:hypothetical protein